jgi:hypothetical protein
MGAGYVFSRWIMCMQIRGMVVPRLGFFFDEPVARAEVSRELVNPLLELQNDAWGNSQHAILTQRIITKSNLRKRKEL